MKSPRTSETTRRSSPTMKVERLHRWDLTPTEAVALQRELAGRIDTRAPLPRWNLVAGADASYNRFSKTVYAGVVVIRTDDFTVVEKQGAVVEVAFPYVPGLLSFREAPALLAAFKKLKSRPDAVMLDGQGFAHPRRVGLACHVGLFLDCPTLGCAKSRLIGEYKRLGEQAGAIAPLVDREETIGMAVRTKKRTRPLFVSVGHKMDLASAVRLVLTTGRGYRVPEPTRQAHLLVNALRSAAAR